MADTENPPITPINSRMKSPPSTPIVLRSPYVARRTGTTLKNLHTAVYEARSRLSALTLDPPSEVDSLSEFDVTSGPATLMTLPAELKLEIFDHLIRPGDVYVHWSARAANHDVRFTHILEEWDANDRENNPIPSKHLAKHLQPLRSPTSPQTQLFLVCKQLRQETLHYYLSHNTFHLMGSDSQLPYPS